MNEIYILLISLAKNILFCLFYFFGTIKVISPNNLIQFFFFFHLLKTSSMFQIFIPVVIARVVKSDKVTVLIS